jgi:hypothetical protein
MMNNRDEFNFLGHDARTGEPFRPPCGASARHVAAAIHAALTEVGLTPQAIRMVGCALLSVSPQRRAKW